MQLVLVGKKRVGIMNQKGKINNIRKDQVPIIPFPLSFELHIFVRLNEEQIIKRIEANKQKEHFKLDHFGGNA